MTYATENTSLNRVSKEIAAEVHTVSVLHAVWCPLVLHLCVIVYHNLMEECDHISESVGCS